MAHKETGRHSRGNPAISRGSTAITVGKYTPTSYYSGSCSGKAQTPCHRISLPGGKSARVPKSPYR